MVVVRTWNLTHVSGQWVHLIGVAEHLGTRLPASTPPWVSTYRWMEGEKCCKIQQTTPHRRQHANHAQLQLCVPVWCDWNVH